MTKTAKLIKSSIYVAKGVTARFTGTFDDAKNPIFNSHGTTSAVSYRSVRVATADEVRAYLGR